MKKCNNKSKNEYIFNEDIVEEIKLKSFKLLFLFVFLIMLVQLYKYSCFSNRTADYLGCGQALIEQNKKKYKISLSTEIKRHFKYTYSVNIVEKYVTIFMILYIMNFYVKGKEYKHNKLFGG